MCVNSKLIEDYHMSEESLNPLIRTLHARVPGETFRLPSQALFYKDSELDENIKNAEVHVLPLTVFDEINLKSPDKLLSGKAIEEVFSNCIPGIKKPLSLLAKDVDYLLMCLRLLSYGPTIDITHKHTCEEAKDHTYTIALRPLISKSVALDPTSMETLFLVTLDNSQIVKLKPVTYGSLVDTYQAMAFENTQDETLFEASLQKRLINVVADMIECVDDVTDQEFIREWLSSIPTGFVKKIADATAAASHWGPDLKHTVQCLDCNQDTVIEIPINPVSFFM